MNTRERAISLKKRKQTVKRYRVILWTILLCILILVVSLSFGFITKADAVSKSHSYKYYTDIVVAKGDNLWDIANRYMTEEYDSPKTYIKEVQNINSLTNANQIYEGQRIVVPYYSSELK